VLPERDVVRVMPAGELDVATVREVDDKVRELQQAGFAEVLLDLRRLTFMDFRGLHLILRAEAFARQDGTRFVLIAGPPAVQRALEVSGMDAWLPYRDA